MKDSSRILQPDNAIEGSVKLQTNHSWIFYESFGIKIILEFYFVILFYLC